jgi:ATP-dependent Clp protease protease subunit
MHHKATLNGYLAQFTGQSLDRITEDTDRDFFMSAHEAKDYGLVDEIIMSTRAQEVQQSNIPMYASSPP